MWQSDDSQNPDKEILAAVRPSMATTGGTLFAIGSPHARKGETWHTYRKHMAPTEIRRSLWPTGRRGHLTRRSGNRLLTEPMKTTLRLLPASWAAYAATIWKAMSRLVIDACTNRGVFQIDYRPGIYYTAHADPSGGSQDSFTVAIGDTEGDVGILDLLLERRPPFPGGPAAVAAEFCEILKGYGLYEVSGDRNGSGFNTEAFRKSGVEYRHSEMTTSDFYSGFLPILNSRRVQLLDNSASQWSFVRWNAGHRGLAGRTASAIRLVAMTTARR